MRTFRLFISSPGDAAVERRRSESVVSRLNGEFAGVARLTTIRWETEFYGAHATFQTQIPAAAECDVVVGILRWRLGTELPPSFADHLPGGEPYPSGTAYEILTAIEKRKAGGELPDVFVFRFAGGAPTLRIDDPGRVAVERDWATLRGFFARWFVSEEGHFLAAMNSYASEDDFEHQLETLLRKWLSDKVSHGRSVPWPPTKGSPFRDLGVFGTRHAPVFFGRSGDVRKAMDLWRARAAQGTAFLLLVGASGAGKSSLARAGLIPRLTTAGVVPEVDLWRAAVLRPGDSPDGPFVALAKALLLHEADLPPEEEGRGPALPEIADGDFRTPADLAAMLGHADAGAVRVVVNALARIGRAAAEADRHANAMRCDLVLLVDQLDELFAASLAPDLRDRFADLLAALVASGRVWLMATLRADLYAPMLGVPALKRLKDEGASYDLAPPGAAELAEIVRAPALAANLVFDQVAATGERLDEVLLREADRPDMLPLVQLALSRLWDARETRGAETVLPVAAFERLGGVKGIVEDAGERALAGLGSEERARLPRLLRGLAELSHGQGGTAGALTARAVPLDEVASDPPSRALVDALVAARLLTLVGEGGATAVRLAHQRVLSDWSRAASVVAESADFYRVRDEVEDQRHRWEAGRRRSEFLLARGLPLAEARDMAMRYGAELSPETRAFIAASRRRANRAQIAAWTAAAVFALVAVGAGVAARIAYVERAQAELQRQEAERQKEEADRQRVEAERQKKAAEAEKEEAERQKTVADEQREEAERQKQAAERSFRAAKATVDGLIFNIAQGLQNVAGMRVATIRTILDTAQKTVNDLLASAPDDPQLLRSQSVMLNDFAATYMSAGDLKDAIAAATQSLDIARKLVARDPGSVMAARDVTVSLERLGDADLQAGDEAGALAAETESLDVRRKLAAKDPGDAQAQRDVSIILNKIGDIRLRSGDQPGARAAFQESLDIARKIAAEHPGRAEARRDVSISLDRIGDMEVLAGEGGAALADYTESLDIRRRLVVENPGDAQMQRDVSVSLEKIGDLKARTGDRAGALAAYQESEGIRRRLAAQDPGNAGLQLDLSIGLERLGMMEMATGDLAAALAVQIESLGIRRKLAAQDPRNLEAQRDVSISLNKIGDLKLRAGDQSGSLAAFQESLDLVRRLAAQNPGNVQVQRDVSISLNDVGDVKLQTGDRVGALRAYEDSLDIVRRQAARDPNDAQARRDLSVGLNKVGDMKLLAADAAGAAAAYREGLAIARSLAAKDPANTQAGRDVSFSLGRLGDAERQMGDVKGALSAYEEALAIARRILAKDGDDVTAEHDVLVDLQRVGDVDQQLGDRAAALATQQEGLGIARRLVAQSPANPLAERDLELTLGRIAPIQMSDGDPAAALATAQEGLDIARKLAARGATDVQWRLDLAQALGAVAIPTLITRDFAHALALTDEALAISPQTPWLLALRAHALMLLGRTDEARALYLHPPGGTAGNAQAWRQVVAAGFGVMRHAGIDDPLMAEIEAGFGKASAKPQP